MSRTALSLNTKIPPPGQAFICKDLKTNMLIRCASVAHRDILKLGKRRIPHLRDTSNDPSAFWIKFGSHNNKIKVVKILCGAEHKRPLSEDQRFLWLDCSLSEARKKHMSYLEPGYKANAGLLDRIFAGDVSKKDLETSTSQPATMKKHEKSGKRMGRPLGSKNRKVVKQEVPALPISELTMRNPENIPVAPTLAPRLAEALAKETQVAEMTLKHPITVSPEQKVKLEAIQKDFDEQVRKLMTEEAQPQAT